MDVPFIYYKGYRASGRTSDGEEIKLDVDCGNNQVVRIYVPAEFDGQITVDFKEPFYWRIAEAVSLFAAAGTLFLLYVKIWNCNKMYDILKQ